MRQSLSCQYAHAEHARSRWSRLGLAGFTLFLLKGVLWLLAPVLFTLWH